MRSRELTIDQRRASLLDHLGTHGRASVAELSELFGVSAVTVRTDLQALSESRLVRRVHGGAVPVPAAEGTGPTAPQRHPPAGPDPVPGPQPKAGPTTADAEPPPARPSRRDAREASALGAAAAQLVSSGDALLLDGGPVSTWLVKALIRRRDLRDLTICTNDLHVALELRPATPRFAAFVAGGSLRASGTTLVEPFLGPALDRMRADLCFLSCAGVDRDAGVTGTDFEQAAIWQRYFHGAQRRVLIAPGTAVGQRGQVSLAAADDLDLLLTAASAPAGALDDLRGTGLQVITVD